MHRFDISRTNALHYLKSFEVEGLITRSKKNKSIQYQVSSEHVLRKYFDNKIVEIEKVKKDIFEPTSEKLNPIKGGKLKLCIVNYLDITESTKEALSKFYDIEDYSRNQLYISHEEFLKRSKNAQVIINNYACKLKPDILNNLPNLQYMALATHMYKYVPIDQFRSKGVSLSNIPYSYKSTAVTEFVIAQTFSLLRPTEVASRQVKVGVNEFKNFQGEQLRGKIITIFGTDSGTLELVNTLRGLGVEVMIYSEDVSLDPTIFGVSSFATKNDVFQKSEIMYFSWTGDEYKELVSALDSNFFNLLRKPVYIISVYKHKKIDYLALREAIYSGKVKGLALDYFPEIANRIDSSINSILHLPNVQITPDISWYTNQSIELLNKYLLERLLAYANGDNKFLIV